MTKLGAIFPQTEIGSDTGAIREYAQATESLGYDFLLAFDHVPRRETPRRTPTSQAPTATTTPSTSHSCCSATSPPLQAASNSPPASSSCPSARPRSWQSRRRRLMC